VLLDPHKFFCQSSLYVNYFVQAAFSSAHAHAG
jgi:hypothetical protein